MKRKYYYIISDDGKYVVTEIARGGSCAGWISSYQLATDTNFAPLLFNNPKDVCVKDFGKNFDLSDTCTGTYWWKDPGKKRYEIKITWTIKEIEIDI